MAVPNDSCPERRPMTADVSFSEIIEAHTAAALHLRAERASCCGRADVEQKAVPVPPGVAFVLYSHRCDLGPSDERYRKFMEAWWAKPQKERREAYAALLAVLDEA